MTRESGDASLTEAVASGHLGELPGRLAELVRYALKLTSAPATVTAHDVNALRGAGLDDRAIVDLNQVVSYFNYVNRVADGLGVELEETWPTELRASRRYLLKGHERLPLVARSSFPTLDLAQAREMDRLMIEELGVPLERMMENAGRAITVVARARLGGSVANRQIAVYAGRGGNGGGGLVAARHLANGGARVRVVTAGPSERLAPTTRSQWEIARAMGIPCAVGATPAARADLVIDALHGYALRGNPRPETAQLIRALAGDAVVSVDVPSGLEVASGALVEPHVRADATVALAAPKRGTFVPASRDAVGDVYVADISVPGLVFERLEERILPDVFDRGGVVRLERDDSP